MTEEARVCEYCIYHVYEQYHRGTYYGCCTNKDSSEYLKEKHVLDDCNKWRGEE